MKVLVTGGTGYLGRAIVGELARRGHQPIAFARRADQATDLPCPAIAGDIPDHRGLRDAVREVVRAAVSRGVPIVSIVPGVIYGPGVDSEGNLVGRLFREHLAGRLPGLIGADRIWSFAFVDDVAAVHVEALERGDPGEEFIAGGDNMPQIRAFELLRELLGTPLPRRIPRLLGLAAALVDEKIRVWWRSPEVTTGTVRILTLDWPLNSAHSVQKLSYRVTPLQVGVKRLVEGLF